MKKFCLALIGTGMVACFPAHAAPADPAVASATPATTQPKPTIAPVANPKVVMLRLYVGDIARGEKFYHEVFGAITLQKMGDNVRIMNFPGGALPGIILIQSPDEVRMNGSFVIQVADVQATLDKAAANGGTLMNTKFAQQVEGMPARSSHFTDPDGNIIEVLQIGKPAK